LNVFDDEVRLIVNFRTTGSFKFMVCVLRTRRPDPSKLGQDFLVYRNEKNLKKQINHFHHFDINLDENERGNCTFGRAIAILVHIW